ncbi:MAG: hypothetical protein ACXVH1_19555 [Solirubrobacteraceae bacterium]
MTERRPGRVLQATFDHRRGDPAAAHARLAGAAHPFAGRVHPEGPANRPLRLRDRTEISVLVLADLLAVGSAPVLSLEEGAEC